jgi:hypothetical protein
MGKAGHVVPTSLVFCLEELRLVNTLDVYLQKSKGEEFIS